MKTILFNGLTEEEKKALLGQVKSSILRDQILKFIDQELSVAIAKADYDNPSWSHKQAHINGQREAYNKIKKLFDHKET